MRLLIVLLLLAGCGGSKEHPKLINPNDNNFYCIGGHKYFNWDRSLVPYFDQDDKPEKCSG